ncbi:glycosyltransferase family 4 protein [Variovorax sp. J22R133]|uniref:glycosyltransferase family 4 protein n=1 Tax=Variovorax brevis TaxID=3053503 RepID=UPI0025766FB7|nr:glycosyltransferase family 4 protein [Variovorax sp. J22R133]MDM0112638.1 glycosyltransferase family 4 protein [Variovorax sp. J22R133]
MDRFFHLAACLEADVLEPAWPEDIERLQLPAVVLEPSGHARVRRHFTCTAAGGASLRAVRDFVSYLLVAWRLMRSGRRYDAIVSFGFFKTSLAGLLLARLTRLPWVIEVAVRQDRILDLRTNRRGLMAGIGNRFSMALTNFLLRRADRLRLMYPGQVDAFSGGRNIQASAFPDFVPVSRLAGREKEDYVLVIGSPLYLKGADVAILAFLKVASQLPGHTLRVVGHAPDQAHFRALAKGHPRISFFDPVPRAQALDLIAGARCLMAPSRSDAMPRTVIEAMAMRTPVIASDVDGLGHYLRQGENSLLCAAGDADALAGHLLSILVDPSLAGRLAENAQRWVASGLTEAHYVERYHAMLMASLSKPQAPRPGTRPEWPGPSGQRP